MQLVVVSHKVCWPDPASPLGYATDGGFPLQMRALGELFDRLTLCVPCALAPGPDGLTELEGNLTVVPLTPVAGDDLRSRRRQLPRWLARNLPALWRAARDADAIHALIPGDVGTFGIALAEVLRKPLFVRHCGNWGEPRTRAEHLWRRYMEARAGGRNVMMATGLAAVPPSVRNRNLEWIFSTTVPTSQIACVHRELPANRLRLVTVARQERLKGTATVIEAVATLRATYPSITLDVVGDGPDLERNRALAADLGVSTVVTFHGRVDHGAALRTVAASDLFVFPSRASEGFPKVIAEAMAFGVPVVASGVSALPAVLQEGAGMIVDPTSLPAVVQAVASVADNPELYAEMSRAALLSAHQFTLERWSAMIEQRLERRWGPLRAPHPAEESAS